MMMPGPEESDCYQKITFSMALAVMPSALLPLSAV